MEPSIFYEKVQFHAGFGSKSFKKTRYCNFSQRRPVFRDDHLKQQYGVMNEFWILIYILKLLVLIEKDELKSILNNKNKIDLGIILNNKTIFRMCVSFLFISFHIAKRLHQLHS